MSAGVENEVNDLLDQARRAAGASQIMLLEEAVRLADSHGEVRLGYDARQELIQAATFSGHPEKALVAFTWCLAQFDRDPAAFDSYRLLWRYKWILGRLPNFPQVSRRQIEDAAEDMRRRYEQFGSGLRAVYKLQMDAALDMGDWEAARAHHARWQAARRDWLADCPACELNREIAFQIEAGNDEQAVSLAAPIVAGRMKCAEIPHATFGKLLLPLLRLGRPEEAMRHHRRGYRLIAGNEEFLYEASEHLTFLVLTDNLAKGTTLLARHLPWALATSELARRFAFQLAARLLLGQLQGAGRKRLTLRLPASLAAHREGGTYEVGALADWLDEDLRALAARFDERNSNDYFSRRIVESQDLLKLRRPVPLRGAAGEEGPSGR
jgi:hypothetical protein